MERSPEDWELDQLVNDAFESELIAGVFRGSSPVDENQDSLQSPQSPPPRDAAPETSTDEDTPDDISPPTSPASFVLPPAQPQQEVEQEVEQQQQQQQQYFDLPLCPSCGQHLAPLQLGDNLTVEEEATCLKTIVLRQQNNQIRLYQDQIRVLVQNLPRVMTVVDNIKRDERTDFAITLPYYIYITITDTFRYLYLRKFNTNVVGDKVTVCGSEIFIQPEEISAFMGYLAQFHDYWQ